MNITLDELIINRLDQLIRVIDLLPFSFENRTELKYIVATDFHDSTQFDDEKNSCTYLEYLCEQSDPIYFKVKTTRGIVNLAQLNRYLREFVSGINYYSKKSLEKLLFVDQNFEIETSPQNRIDDFRLISRFDFLKRYQLNFISYFDIYDINSEPVENIGSYYKYGSPKINNYFRTKIIYQEFEIYQVEELEILLCIAAAEFINDDQYKDFSQTEIKAYFENYLKVKLFNLYIERSNKKFSFMTNSGAIQYLGISCNQFQRFWPELRNEPVYDLFFQILFFPETPPEIPEDNLINFFSWVYESYFNHFDKYQIITKETFENLLGKTHMFVMNPNLVKTNYRNKFKYLDTIFKNLSNDDNERSKFTSLYNYYNEWHNCTVTLSQWQEFKIADLISFFKTLDLPERTLENIQSHQFQLYCEYTDRLFNQKYKKKFDQMSDQDRMLIGPRDLKLLNKLILLEVGRDESEKLRSLFSVHFAHKTAKQLENIISNSYESPRNYDIHYHDPNMFLNECYAESEALYKYRNYIAEYVNRNNNSTHLIAGIQKKALRAEKALPIAYKYKQNITNSSALPRLHQYLIKKAFISGETTIDNFRKIFDNTKPDPPIKWIGNMVELVYFIKHLHNEDELIDKMAPTIWKVTAKLFTDENSNFWDWEKLRGQTTPPARLDLIRRAADLLK